MQQTNIQSHKDNITFACEGALAKFAHYDVDVLFFFCLPSEHAGVQSRTSAVVEFFSQVQKSPQIPEGESVPDFEEKLRPITAREGEVISQHLEISGKRPLRPLNISLHIALRTTVSPLRQKANFRSSPNSLPGNSRWHQGSETLLLRVNFREPHSSPGGTVTGTVKPLWSKSWQRPHRAQRHRDKSLREANDLHRNRTRKGRKKKGASAEY